MNRKPQLPQNSPEQENVDRAKLWINRFDVTAKDIKDKARKYFGSDSVRLLNNEQMDKLEDMLK